ncbi:AAA domain-containing protein, putative AbiEii toxin, Type IV TA system [Lachnospiraceae bacterium RM5]|nr:AAA domain-containing protein, putative AbiEii toxin, Type IV TA system [Lachnospiraceae bacterium RM5]
MQIRAMTIKNFKSVRCLEIKDIENACIFVGKNNTGKTVVLDAIRAVAGEYSIKDENFMESGENIEITMTLEVKKEDLELLNARGIISKYKKFENWYEEFMERLPSYVQEEDEEVLEENTDIVKNVDVVEVEDDKEKFATPKDGYVEFTFVYNREHKARYQDNKSKNNSYIKELFPKVYFIDVLRNIKEYQEDLIRIMGNKEVPEIIENLCVFDKTKICNKCFECIGLIKEKTVDELSLFEVTRLLEYKIFSQNLDEFSNIVNKYFEKNGGNAQYIKYVTSFNYEAMFKVETMVGNKDRGTLIRNIDTMSAGMKSIYLLSLMEAYLEEKERVPSIMLIEDPESYLHPQLQKSASEVLYRLSKKNQIVFSTHSPNMLFNFSTKQIKQVVLDDEGYTIVNEDTDIDDILDDLGYTANDLMNVSFVFIVEGKQDSERLPMLLEKYYSEIYDDRGMLQRISIISTNSCTNIKTYANLKYINKLYLKDQFLMIRDSDGKNPKYLVKQLCSYYAQREKEDNNNLPRVTPKNVLVLKYYSFENYFLDPKVMAKIGVIKNEEEFYNILWQKYRDYLYRVPSMKRMCRICNVRIKSKEDIKRNMENIKIYVRGHNLFDIFYGKYRNNEHEIIKKYIDVAPRENFSNILDAIDKFVYFENRKKDE